MTSDRTKKVVGLFKSGYNCSQSVVAAFASMYGLTEEQALRMSASFGGGIGRMHQTCGAACGMFLLTGLEKGAVDDKDCKGKTANRALIQELAEKSKKRNGSMICTELPGLKKPEDSSTPEMCTEQHYAKCPCTRTVKEVVIIWAEYLKKQQEQAETSRFHDRKTKKKVANALCNIEMIIFAAEMKSDPSLWEADL